MENIYHNECACLFAHNIMDDRCHKRYYQIIDWKTGIPKNLFICNELLRLKLNQRRAEEKRYYGADLTIYDIVTGIISKYVEITRGYPKDSNDLVNKSVRFNVCRKLGSTCFI